MSYLFYTTCNLRAQSALHAYLMNSYIHFKINNIIWIFLNGSSDAST